MTFLQSVFYTLNRLITPTEPGTTHPKGICGPLLPLGGHRGDLGADPADMVVIQTELGARGGACQSWEVGEFHGKGEVGFGGDFFLTAFIPSGLGLSTSWEPAEAGSGEGSSHKACDLGVCGDAPPDPHPHCSGPDCF